jgi:hypothetical protein
MLRDRGLTVSGGWDRVALVVVVVVTVVVRTNLDGRRPTRSRRDRSRHKRADRPLDVVFFPRPPWLMASTTLPLSGPVIAGWILLGQSYPRSDPANRDGGKRSSRRERIASPHLITGIRRLPQ